MKSENTELIREKVLSLIDAEFESGAAFERAMSLSPKTVNNWRRGLSSSFMQMLPALSDLFGVNISELLDLPIRRDTSELSEDELRLLHVYRKSRILPHKLRTSLTETLETTVNLYLTSYQEVKSKAAKRKS